MIEPISRAAADAAVQLVAAFQTDAHNVSAGNNFERQLDYTLKDLEDLDVRALVRALTCTASELLDQTGTEAPEQNLIAILLKFADTPDQLPPSE